MIVHEPKPRERFRRGAQVYVRAPNPIAFPSEERPEEKMSESKRHLELRTTLYLILNDAFADTAIGSEQFVYFDAGGSPALSVARRLREARRAGRDVRDVEGRECAAPRRDSQPQSRTLSRHRPRGAAAPTTQEPVRPWRVMVFAGPCPGRTRPIKRADNSPERC